jgi:hypothetical protein
MAARIVASARFHPDRIGATLDRGFLDATVLAEYLVARGVAFRTAHQVVGRLVRVCDKTRRHALAQLHVDEIREALGALGHDPSLVGADVFEHLGAANVARQYRSAGHAGSGAGGYKDWLASLGHAPTDGATPAPRSPAPRAALTSPREAEARHAPPPFEPNPPAADAEAEPAPAGEVSGRPHRGRAEPDPTPALESNAPTDDEPPFVPTGPGASAAKRERRPATPAEPPPMLFADEQVDTSAGAMARWAPLIEAYAGAGRTLDDLPYTPEFDALVAAASPHYPDMDRYALFRRLHNLRKAGKLPKTPPSARPAGLPVKLSPEEEAWLRDEVVGAVGSLGQRDQLPYSPRFDALVEAFNARTGRGLEPHAVWRLVAKLAK